MLEIFNEADKLILSALNKKVFSGIAVGVSLGFPGSKKRENIIRYYGRTSYEKKATLISRKTFFDLASLTKPLATTLSIISLIKENKLNWSDTLADSVKIPVPVDKRKIKLVEILTHSAGFVGYNPYFKRLNPEQCRDNKEKIVSWILKESLEYKPGEGCCYSDLGFILLGKVIENISGTSLDEYFKNSILKPLGLEDEIFFNRMGEKKEAAYKKFAATEECSWRGKVLQGKVHDEHCWAMGGVAGHAGLFGTTGGVLALIEHISDMWHGRKNHPNLRNEDIVRALKKKKESNWTCGFDTPSAHGSTSGRYFSPRSVGHLGFTGTSFWCDLQRDIVIVLLTNRVHPTRKNTKIREFRPLFHDKIMESIIKFRKRS